MYFVKAAYGVEKLVFVKAIEKDIPNFYTRHTERAMFQVLK